MEKIIEEQLHIEESLNKPPQHPPQDHQEQVELEVADNLQQQQPLQQDQQEPVVIANQIPQTISQQQEQDLKETSTQLMSNGKPTFVEYSVSQSEARTRILNIYGNQKLSLIDLSQLAVRISLSLFICA